MQAINLLLDFSMHYVIITMMMYLVWCVASIMERAIYQSTGYTYCGLVSALYTWGVCNPTWAWNIMPTTQEVAPRYFL